MAGRPKNPTPVAELAILTIPQACALLRQLGRPLSRTKLAVAIAAGRLVAQVDELRHDRFGHPLLMVYRRDLDRWLSSTLRQLRPAMAADVARRIS